MIEIPLSDVGLLSVADLCARFDVTPKTVQNWVALDLLPVVRVGSARGTFLFREADVKKFVKPQRGAPTGARNKTKK